MRGLYPCLDMCIYTYIVYFATNAARRNKSTNRHTDTQYTGIKLYAQVCCNQNHKAVMLLTLSMEPCIFAYYEQLHCFQWLITVGMSVRVISVCYVNSLLECQHLRNVCFIIQRCTGWLYFSAKTLVLNRSLLLTSFLKLSFKLMLGLRPKLVRTKWY